jgi:uncharacterized protein YydD (DUF2326 family)
MINKITSDKKSFRTVSFNAGFNIILADVTEESTILDTRNGVGKSTLIDIIHFCLGSRRSRSKSTLIHPILNEWKFSLYLTIQDRNYTISRKIGENFIYVNGDCTKWPIKYIQKNLLDEYKYSRQNLVDNLESILFGISPHDNKFSPSFRSLISYFIRRGSDGYLSPFSHNKQQQEWDRQINTAFLLDLQSSLAQDLQEIKSQEKSLKEIKKSSKSNLFEQFIGSYGELEAQRVRFEQQVNELSEQLKNYKVHKEYEKIEDEASNLTQRIRSINNQNVIDKQMIRFYDENLKKEKIERPSDQNLVELYKEINIVFPELVIKKLNEVKNFHEKIIKNRFEHLETEIQKAQTRIDKRNDELVNLTKERSRILDILKTYGALDEYTELQKRLGGLQSKLQVTEIKVRDVKKIETGLRDLKINREIITKEAQLQLEENKAEREKAIKIFNSNSNYLYKSPGNLIIEFNNNGYSFDVEIEREGSAGIENMKIFCYDLMVAELWSEKHPNPGFLIHDSTIFSDVDSRQIARALELAYKKSKECGFQYICLLNSDSLPTKDNFITGLDVNKFVVMRLTDNPASGSLLGLRF